MNLRIDAVPEFVDCVIFSLAIKGGKHTDDLRIGDVFLERFAVVAADDIAVGRNLDNSVKDDPVSPSVERNIQTL